MSDQDEARDQDIAVKQDNQPAQRPNEENYEDEEEEDEGNGDKPPNRRAEMWGDWKEGQPIAASCLDWVSHPIFLNIVPETVLLGPDE